MVLKYTKRTQFKTTSILKNNDRKTAVFIKAKEVLVRKSAFLKPLANFIKPLVIPNRFFYTKITKEVVA